MRARLVGWALVAYGVAGIILVVGGSLVGLEAAARVERLAAAADGTLAAAASSTDAAARAFASADVSLSEAEASADGAAALARDASGTLASLAAAMELSVFGAQPLLPLSGEFEASAAQAAALADTLDGVGGSLADTRADAVRIGAELEGLSSQLGSLRDASATGGTVPAIRPLVLLLLAWLLLPALGALVAGVVLLGIRPPRRAAAG